MTVTRTQSRHESLYSNRVSFLKRAQQSVGLGGKKVNSDSIPLSFTAPFVVADFNFQFSSVERRAPAILISPGYPIWCRSSCLIVSISVVLSFFAFSHLLDSRTTPFVFSLLSSSHALLRISTLSYPRVTLSTLLAYIITLEIKFYVLALITTILSVVARDSEIRCE